MNSVFADTSFYVAALSRRDASHHRAETVGRALNGDVITTHYVLLEVATFFCASSSRAVFLELLQSLEDDPKVSIVPASSSLWQRGIDFFASRPDKDWSLTDCISFVVMNEQGITQALTTDHHFEQAGFEALLRPD